MSGDVQPRKRKDKKRRKDEGEQIPTQTHAPLSTNSSNDDLNIHIHKEGGTGGGLCAKLVFFVLLSAIAVLIGMIITEYRGQTDVDTVDTESRFSQIFEGWIDASPDHHDHDIEEDLEDHVLDHDEEEDVDNNSEPEDEDDEHESSQEEDEEELISADNEISEEDEDNEEDQDEDEEQDDQTLEESEENQLDQDEDDDEVQGSEEEERETYEDSNEKEDEDVEADEDDDEDHDDDEQELQNIDSEEKENDNDDELDDEEDEISAENKSDEGEEEYDDDDDNDKVDEDDADEHNEKVPDTAKKIKIRDVGNDEAPPNEKQQESSGMAVKLGVGVALLVVAHLVLVRKWRSAPDDKPSKEESKEPTPDLSRRNTIVVPPTYQEVEQDIEQEEEENFSVKFSLKNCIKKHEQTDYSDEEVSEEESRDEPKSAKTKYQELRSTYTRSLTPEGEIDYHKPSETYDDEYEDNIEDEADEEVSEEEEDDEEGDEEEDEEGDEEDESENEEFDEDEELLKRLEAKYGKLHDKHKGDKYNNLSFKSAAAHQDVEDSDSDKQSDEAAGYEYSNITSKEDYKIKGEIDKAQKKVQNNSAYAIKLFDKILQKYPSSPRSIYGKALALDYLADQRRSNEILEQALKIYIHLLNTENVPHALFEMAAERCINRMRFVGQYKNAIMVHKQLIKRFPNNPKHTNDLAVTYLTINRVEEARSVLKEVLRMWPNNGFALVHLGFIFKTSDNKLQEAVEYLRRGLDTKDKGVIDGRFYFHLGDAMTRLGQNKEAMEVYEEGVKNEVFLSKYQRSLYNVPRLTGKPWWQLEDLPYLDLYRLLKQNWHKIKEEGLAALNEKGYFQDESENLRDSGEWKQFELFARGQKNARNCKKCPFTCSIIEKIPEARGCKRGQTKFSVMHPGTHVWPHCGPTNCRLRTHLGLKVPPKTFIRVAEEIRSWDEGEIFVFDDSFEHEVWHNGTEFRLVLIIDVWHPELTPVEKRNLSPI
ncbi:hypothetical protein NQ314_013121 [Rhamnusium bicolor]|uniref:Aspartyl/asparaginy/proline hydroxylase domain-containing protein n=1 Tax=Rhamnusium bicolor TaxID=1586634 RepID=A0AAV8X8J5_9CUCU|nr:hypothetical protein NQ314_013121 [Rhamnusium bicolor]